MGHGQTPISLSSDLVISPSEFAADIQAMQEHTFDYRGLAKFFGRYSTRIKISRNPHK